MASSRWARGVCRAGILALCLALGFPAFAVVLPPAVAAQHPEFDRVGGGEMRWLGFKLYDAALWASARGEAAMGDAHVLSIRYSRAIGSERLVAVSLLTRPLNIFTAQHTQRPGAGSRTGHARGARRCGP